MARVIRRLQLSRRTFLRGAGASLALPWLDAMTGALCPVPPPPKRALFVFVPNGMTMEEWTPKMAPAKDGQQKDGQSKESAPPAFREQREFELPYLLEPIAPYRDDLLVLTGLDLDAGRAHGDGPGDHARAAATYLTCMHPRKTAGPDIKLGVSVDQVIAGAVGSRTRFPSLEIGMEKGRTTGSCDSGYSCAYSSCVSWRSETAPVAKEVKPRVVFARLFGDPDKMETAAAAARRRCVEGSVLDATLADAKRLRRELGTGDKARLEEYLTAVREIESRLVRNEPEADNAAAEELLERVHSGKGYIEQLRLMYDMLALAFEADMTRTATFMVGNAGSNRSYRWIDVREGHHSLSHHRGDKAKVAQIRRINRFHTEEFARFLGRMRRTVDGPGTLLDHSMVVWGSGLSDGNRHRHHDLPILVAGRGGGVVKPGRHLVFPEKTPMANLYLAMLHGLGVEADSFADSKGALPGLG